MRRFIRLDKEPKKDLRVAFGKRVRELRERLGVSQEAFAHLCELHRTYVGGIERGERNPSLVNIGRIADALGVSVKELFAAPAFGRSKSK